MATSFMCLNCQAGDCDRCYDTPAPKGVLGGNYCPCRHDPDAREANRRRMKRMFSKWGAGMPDDTEGET